SDIDPDIESAGCISKAARTVWQGQKRRVPAIKRLPGRSEAERAELAHPLDGLRVISMAEQYPGPYATLILAGLGADVILVERPQGGDPARQFASFFEALNRNKRSIAVDLKSPEGRAVVERLVSRSDVFLEGFRPGTANRLGLGYDALMRLNPAL